MQQDLFFVSSCLIEEISVENNLALLVVDRLGQLAQYTSFPSQQIKAIKTLGSLMRTRQYAYFGTKKLEGCHPELWLFRTLRATSGRL